jgi:transcriptional regulator with XRE-family HTH domain
LLGLDQKDVADASGVNVNVLSRIERGEARPQERTLAKLSSFYERAGIEFLETDGVRRRKALVHVYEGQSGFRQVMDQVYETARDRGGPISLFNGPPRLFLKWLGEDWYAMHAARMRKVKSKIDFRIIVKEGERAFIAGDFARYRWFPKKKFRERTFYAFGDRVAFLNFEDDVRIVVIEQEEMAESFHILFDIAWDHMAIEPD